MNPPTTVPEQTIIRVSVSEAARLFGISQQTVRRALKNNAISFIVIGNRYKIDFASLFASLSDLKENTSTSSPSGNDADTTLLK